MQESVHKVFINTRTKPFTADPTRAVSEPHSSVLPVPGAVLRYCLELGSHPVPGAVLPPLHVAASQQAVGKPAGACAPVGCVPGVLMQPPVAANLRVLPVPVRRGSHPLQAVGQSVLPVPTE